MVDDAWTKWWRRVSASAPSDLAGLWFGVAELVAGWHLYVAGTDTFDASDETGDWAAADYAWWPEDRYAPLPHRDDPYEVLRLAVEVVRSLAPWQDVPVHGVAVGFDDGDFEVVFTRS